MLCRNEDMSAYVKKVHFKLHDSYANPNRILTKPPYEVSQHRCGYLRMNKHVLWLLTTKFMSRKIICHTLLYKPPNEATKHLRPTT